jgi:hypothetical protein
MPDLTTQIETLYRVIGQLEPGSDPGSRRDPQLSAQIEQPRALPTRDGFVPPSGRFARVHWICSFYCLWFSLPFSVWLSTGWIGLFFYWRTLSGTARLLEILTRRPSLPRKEWKFRKGGAPCSAINLEAQ